MARTPPSKAELAELAQVHLYYEVAMLRGGAAENRRRRIARPDIERLNRAEPQRVSCMAFFEAALMHGRVLNDFLTARPNAKRYPEDVWAGDYITGWKAPNPGPLKRAEAIGSNRAIKDAIDKQLAHLSIRRVRGQRRFDIDGIVDAIVHDMKTFAEDETNLCYAEVQGVADRKLARRTGPRRRRRQRDTGGDGGRSVSAALLLVRDSDGGGELPPLVAWELFMRDAGRSERTVRDGVATMQRLERNAGKGCDQLAPVDVSRFLADPDLGASSRAAYFGSISAFYRWWATQGGTNITARLPWPRSPKLSPRPVSGPGLS